MDRQTEKVNYIMVTHCYKYKQKNYVSPYTLLTVVSLPGTGVFIFLPPPTLCKNEKHMFPIKEPLGGGYSSRRLFYLNKWYLHILIMIYTS